jgi:hypothetical protein
MAGELLLINPRARRRRSPRRMSALQRKYFGKRRSRKVSRVRRNPRRRTRRAVVATTRRRTRRRTHRRSYRVTRARRNPTRRRRSFSVRGITGGAMGFAKDKLLPGAIGGAGALAVDLAWPYAAPYLPQMLVTGAFVPVTRIGLAILIGMAGKMVGGKRFGEEVLNGAIIVTLYDVMKGYAVAAEPSIFGQPAASQSATAQIAMQCNSCGQCGSCCCDDGSMSRYVSGVGWTSPGRQVGYSFG